MPGRVFSGIRPTGRAHLGNYLGAIQNYVALQAEYECIYCIVDVHALTTIEDTQDLQLKIHEIALDLLAAGLDPERKNTILFVQSHVPEVMTLHTLLSMVTPLGWLLRVPTFKEKVRQMQESEESVNYGLVGYPILMTADIVLYKADTVPIGEDQLPHLELAREIARRFNNTFGQTFPEPKARLTNAPMILGLDGQQKMSKSLDNHIELALTPEQTKKRVMTAVTDPQRRYRADSGRPEVCNVFSLHKIYNPGEVGTVGNECRNALRGCVECKQQLAEGINRDLAPFRARRQELAAKPDYVKDILAESAHKASKIAKATIEEVKGRMGLI